MLQGLPLALSASADRLRPSVAASEWSFARPRHGGRSHLVVLTEGAGTMTLSKGQLKVAAPAFVWLPPGAAQAARLEPGSAGYVLGLSESLVSLAIGRSGDSAALRATADRVVQCGADRGAAEMTLVTDAAATVHREVREPKAGGLELVAALVTVVLVGAHRLSAIGPVAARPDQAAPQLMQRFQEAVELHFREQLPIRRYAADLGVTERRLHDTVTKATGRGPLAVVHARLLEEAKTRLEQSALPVAQIGYGLGFRDPAHFTRFFTKSAGLSPRRYRTMMRQRRLEKENFASWP